MLEVHLGEFLVEQRLLWSLPRGCAQEFEDKRWTQWEKRGIDTVHGKRRCEEERWS